MTCSICEETGLRLKRLRDKLNKANDANADKDREIARLRERYKADCHTDISKPRHNDEAERSIFGSILVDNNSFYEAAAIIRSDEDFFSESSRCLWRAFKELFKRGEGDEDKRYVDVLVLADYLGQRMRQASIGLTELEFVGGPNYLARLSSEVPSATNMPYYATIVKNHADLRNLVAYARSVEKKALALDKAPGELVSEIMEELTGMMAHGSTSSRRTAPQIDDEWEARMKLEASGDTGQASSVGIRGIDYLLGGGLFQGRSIYLGGITKHGKTTISLAMAAHLIFVEGWAVDWYSVEMSRTEIYDKFLGWRAQVDMAEYKKRIRAGNTKTKEFQDWKVRVQNARREWRTKDCEIDVQGSPNVKDIAMKVRARVSKLRDKKRYLFVVDYLQVMHTGDSKQSEYQRITESSMKLNGLTKDLDCNGIVICQFTKDAENSWKKFRQRPDFNQIKGSSQPSQDANHWLVVHRNWLDMPEDPQNIRYTEVTQGLSRHGNMGLTVELDATMAHSRYTTWQGDAPAAQRAHQNGGKKGSSSPAQSFSQSSYSGGGSSDFPF